MILLKIEGQQFSVPYHEPLCYFAEAFTDRSSPYPTHVSVEVKTENAWKFVRTTIENGGYGHVMAYDIVFPDSPKRLKCLGRIDSPTMDPIIP